MNGDVHLRIDLQHPLFHHVRLVLAYRLSRGNDLPVQVGQADLVIVDEVKMAHAAPHQSLTDITAHTADTEYSHSGIFQLLHGRFAEEKLGS